MLLPCLAVALCACEQPREQGASPTSRADTAAGWRFSSSPRARIGNGNGTAGDDLHRVYSGFLASDGRIVLGNSGTAQVRFYDAGGRHVASSGREGSGPGEFRSINWLGRLPGDSILVFDMRMRRFSVLDAGGRFSRSFNETGASPLRPLGQFADGTVLVAAEQQYDPRAPAGVVRDRMILLRMDGTGEVRDTLGAFPGAEWFLYDHPDSFRSTQLPFGRSGLVAVSDTVFFYATSDSSEVSVFSRTGALVRTIHVPAAPRQLTQEEAESYLAQIEDGPERSAIRRFLRQERGRRNAPLLSALRTDRAGNLWVRLQADPRQETAEWVALSAAGARLGRVRTPATWQPLDVHDGLVLVREFDEDGVESVSLREVVR